MVRSEIIAPIGTHGVLITGALDPYRFDETDVDLVSTLVENTRAALDRADHERVLRDRTAELERQTERLEAVAEVLSSDLQHQLAAVADALENERVGKWEFPLAEDTVETTLDRAEQFVDDIREFARNATAVRTRSRLRLESVIEDAVAESRLSPASLVVDASAWLRADRDRFVHLLETAFDSAAARATDDVTIQIGLVGFENGGSRGIFVLDDAAEIPPNAHDRVLDPTADDETAIDGLGLALVRTIAEAHDWECTVTNGANGGTRIEIRDMTTLERRR